MRKLLSIVLMVMFGLPVVSPLFALGTQSSSKLPACCRRKGAHKCEGMDVAQASASTESSIQFRAPVQRCPYQPSALISFHSQTLALNATPVMSNSRRYVAATATPESDFPFVVREVSHHKRGPPSKNLL